MSKSFWQKLKNTHERHSAPRGEGRTERKMVDPGTVTIIALCAYAGLKVSVVGYAVYAYGCSRASRKNCGPSGGADGDEGGEEENQQEEVGRESHGKFGSGKAKEA